MFNLQEITPYLLFGIITSFCTVTLFACKEYRGTHHIKSSYFIHYGIDLIFGIYLTVLFAETIAPVYGWSFPHLSGQINMTAFAVLNKSYVNPVNLIGNILIFIPIGLLLYAILKCRVKFIATILYGCSISIFIELIQLFETRATDIDDIILNTIGTFLGACIAKVISLLARHILPATLLQGAKRKGATLITLLFVSFATVMILGMIQREPSEQEACLDYPGILVDYLSPNEFSRPCTPLGTVNAIVVHYTGNPNSSAEQNHSYFQNLAYTGETSASSHFLVGLEGEVIQCLPLNEQGFATRTRNGDTVAIEVCHPDSSGKFTEASYHSLVSLVASLCRQFNLSADNVIRHYDVTGKLCPKYYVEHKDAWAQFLADVKTELAK